jgi:uncharacterized membrane protein
MGTSAKQISIGGVVGALYFVITITPGISAISYGQFQVRIAEALTVLPFIYPGAIAGLFVGCLLANLFGPFGIQDIVFGSLLTLIAAWLTFLARRTGRPILAPLPPVVLNSLGVAAYLHLFFKEPYWFFVLTIAAGELIACYGLGYPLLVFLLKKEKVLIDRPSHPE